MKMPAKDWEPMQDWADRNNWTRAEAVEHYLAHNEIEGNPSIVRWSPTIIKCPEYVKISKSDQP